jgi:hypothetical protein
MGLRSVEAQGLDRRVRAKEVRDGIRDDRRLVDVGVEAALAGAGCEHVPERDPLGEERRDPRAVGRVRVHPE